MEMGSDDTIYQNSHIKVDIKVGRLDSSSYFQIYFDFISYKSILCADLNNFHV